MRSSSIQVCLLALSCFPVPPCVAGTYTPLDWQTSESVEIGPVPEGPFEVAVGFDRCFETGELKYSLGPSGSHFVIKSDLVSAAVFRFASREEFNDLILPRVAVGASPRATVFQFGPMSLAHGTSVRGHEARESPSYCGRHPYELGIRGANVGIAIVDSGVAAEHIQLDDTGINEARWVAGYDALTDDKVNDPKPKTPHGSAVAGVALGKDVPLYRCRTYECGGMAPKAGLIDIKITDSAVVQISDAIDGLNWLIENHDDFNTPYVVANLSFFTCRDDPKVTSPLAAMANSLVDRGISVVAAHGNASGCGLPSRCDYACTEQTGSPGSARYAITVAGTDDMGKVDRKYHRPFCDGFCGPRREEKPDLSASAELVMAPSPVDGTFDLFARRSGTSVAAAHVSGAVALVKSAKPYMDPVSIRKQLIDSADRQHNPEEKYWDRELGWGILKLDWLKVLAATPPKELADLTFKGCKPETTDGPLANCQLEDLSTPPWRNAAAIVVEGGTTKKVTVNVVNHGPMAVSALVRLEGYDRVIGNRHYYQLGEKTVDLPGDGKEMPISFSVPDAGNRFQHFRASIHSAWDRSYKNNRTQFNVDAPPNTEFRIDSPFFEPAHLEIETTAGCDVMAVGGPASARVVTMTPEMCPRHFQLTSKNGQACDLSVYGRPTDAPPAARELLGGIHLLAPPAQ